MSIYSTNLYQGVIIYPPPPPFIQFICSRTEANSPSGDGTTSPQKCPPPLLKRFLIFLCRDATFI